VVRRRPNNARRLEVLVSITKLRIASSETPTSAATVDLRLLLSVSIGKAFAVIAKETDTETVSSVVGAGEGENVDIHELEPVDAVKLPAAQLKQIDEDADEV